MDSKYVNKFDENVMIETSMPIAVQGKYLAGENWRIWQIVSYSPIPANIDRYTKMKIVAYPPNFSLPTSFIPKFPPPNISGVRYKEMVTSGSIYVYSCGVHIYIPIYIKLLHNL